MLLAYTLAMLGIGLTLLMTPLISRNLPKKFLFLVLFMAIPPVLAGGSGLIVHYSAPIWNKWPVKALLDRTVSSPIHFYSVPSGSFFHAIPSSLKFGEKEQQAFRTFFLRKDVYEKFSNCSDPLINFLENYDIGSYQTFSLCVHKKNEESQSSEEIKHEEELRKKAQQQRLIEMYGDTENAE